MTTDPRNGLNAHFRFATICERDNGMLHRCKTRRREPIHVVYCLVLMNICISIYEPDFFLRLLNKGMSIRLYLFMTDNRVLSMGKAGWSVAILPMIILPS